MSAASNKKLILCKFQNQGFYKFKEKCYFRHVHNVCHDKNCDKVDCQKRHLKPCKYRKCKFKEKCEFSHEDAKAEEWEEFDTLKAKIRTLEIANKKLEVENTNLKKVLEEKSTEPRKINLEKELDEVKQINKNLIEDLKVLNHKLYRFVPDYREIENAQLKENIFVLEAILRSYRDEEPNEEEYFNDDDMDDDDNKTVEKSSPEFKPTDGDLIDFCNYDEPMDAFRCLECNYESNSQRGLNVHFGMKHKEII